MRSKKKPPAAVATRGLLRTIPKRYLYREEDKYSAMQDSHDYIYATFAFVGWELARWQEVIDWAVGLAGAISLIALNLIRLRKAMNNRDVEN